MTELNDHRYDDDDDDDEEEQQEEEDAKKKPEEEPAALLTSEEEPAALLTSKGAPARAAAAASIAAAAAAKEAKTAKAAEAKAAKAAAEEAKAAEKEAEAAAKAAAEAKALAEAEADIPEGPPPADPEDGLVLHGPYAYLRPADGMGTSLLKEVIPKLLEMAGRPALAPRTLKGYNDEQTEAKVKNLLGQTGRWPADMTSLPGFTNCVTREWSLDPSAITYADKALWAADEEDPHER
jgi:hypothetical protein